MNGPYTDRGGKRVLLSTLTLPAPARWPYREHRSMAEVMADEQAVAAAVENYVAGATFAGGCAMENAALGDACNAPREPDRKPSRRPAANAA